MPASQTVLLPFLPPSGTGVFDSGVFGSGVFDTGVSTIYSPSVSQTIAMPRITSGLALHAPSVQQVIHGATIVATSVVRAPSITTGPTTLVGATIPSTALLFPPIVFFVHRDDLHPCPVGFPIDDADFR